ncbi:MAG: cation diffusion facilitator family transporter [Ectothiorhodospiraceae bacterium]|nr:cation diffusion facilitator family transporter [Chromatiales bacterium]MCP5157246.1 cation diffusion facilitator family transporter [Ectothiorhodospiraceae bacterium]
MSTHSPHPHHASAPESRATESRLRLALWLTAGFAVAEVIGGLASGSLALVADAGHMLTDASALGLAWLATRIARRPPDRRRSYGYHRAPVLAAFVNAAVLLAMAVWIVVEAIARLHLPRPVLGAPMLAVALVGLVVNLVVLRVLAGGHHHGHGHHHDLNLRGALLHVIGDLLGSVGAVAAAVVIILTGFTAIDPILSLLVAALIARSAWSLLARSTHVLLEGTPEEVDPRTVASGLGESLPGVIDVHHVHAWSLEPGRPVITLHARMAPGADPEQTMRRIKDELLRRFGIRHSTVQLEQGHCPDRDPPS